MSYEDRRPFFSVIVPTFNREHHIGRCLESIVQQGRPDVQVLVVDNASVDRTVDISLSYYDRLNLEVLVNESNCERSYSRNRGALHACGAFLVFLDSDDELTPGALNRAANFLEAHRECLFFFQRIRIVNESGTTVYEPVIRSRYGMRKTLAEGNPLSCSGVYVDRSLFLRHRFDEHPTLIGSEDWHCWIRIAAEHQPALCPGEGALLVDHGSRTMASDQWEQAQKRFAYLTENLLAAQATRDYLGPFLGLFRGSQDHYVAVSAAGQSALRPSLGLFLRAIRHHLPLLASRRTLHLWRLWLRLILEPARKAQSQ